jgi:hypothetical protein
MNEGRLCVGLPKGGDIILDYGSRSILEKRVP